MRFLFVDQIVQLYPGECIKGIKHVTRDDAYLTKDRHGKSCFIPSLIGETLGQLAAWNVMMHNEFTSRPVAGIVASARLHRPAYVGESILLESYIDSLDDKAVQYHSIARVGNETVFSIEGALGPLLPMEEFISLSAIKQQFAEIYNPGDWAALSQQVVKAEQSEFLPGEIPPTVPLLFDRVVSSDPGVSLVAEKRISRAAAY